MNGASTPRRPSGVPSGGQFAPKQTSDPEVELAGDEALLEAASSSPEDVGKFVRHADWRVRCEVAGSTAASDEHLDELSRDDDWMVRWQVAQRADSTVPLHLVDDSDPRVAAIAVAHPLVDAETRRRIQERPDVARVLDLVRR